MKPEVKQEIIVAPMSINYIHARGRKYLDVDDLIGWLRKSALESTAPTATQTLKIVSDELEAGIRSI